MSTGTVGALPLAPPSATRDQRPLLSACPVCESTRLHYAFSHEDYRVVRCADCTLLLLNPQPSDTELAAIYDAHYFLGDDTEEGRAQVAAMKQATARHYLSEIERYRGRRGGQLLEVGSGQGELLLEASRAGYAVTGVEYSASAVETARAHLPGATIVRGEIGAVRAPAGGFDVCVLSDVIEHTRDPLATLATIRTLLAPDGALFLATPSLDSWSARVLRRRWMEFKPDHLVYFDTNTIQNALFRAGFGQVVVRPGWKVLTLEYVAHHFARYPVPVVGPLVRAAARLAPAAARSAQLRVVASGIAAFARPVPLPVRRTVSVVVPAYNEAATADTLLRGVLAKELPDLDVEVIIVESNSTDGTRAIAERYRHHPRVRLVLEDAPRGKGHAVRTGLQHATGDFVLIQDADLEYDLEDYDALLEPLRQGRRAFVLGSRHGGSAWKMRHFAEARLQSAVLNAGHWFFTMLINVLFRQRLRDPFTMFKVFRRDCLFGLTFECNRFDFDYELLIKLVRKGYRPLEIPVNYRSRSFSEGKKVSVLRDPLTWLRALVRLRLATIDPLREVERRHRT